MAFRVARSRSAIPVLRPHKRACPSLVRQRRLCGADWLLLSGDDATGLGYMSHGGHGCISVTANVAPGLCARFYDACMSGAWGEALSLQDRLTRLHRALFLDASPAPTKFALALLGLCDAEVRLPISACDEAFHAEIRAAMAEAGHLE